MRPDSEELYWNGEVVGVVNCPSLDHFDYYGVWKPSTDAILIKRFFEEVDKDGGACVEIGSSESKLKGTVELAPTDLIQVKIRV